MTSQLISRAAQAEGGLSPGRSLERFLVPAAISLVIVVTIVVGGLTNEAFLTESNVLAILRVAALTGIVALGATFVTIAGRFFSLALAQTAVFGSVAYALLLQSGLPFLFALGMTLVLGVVLGILQGVVVSAGANPIVTTLGAGALLAGLAGLATGGKSLRISDDATAWIGNARPFGVPTQTWAFLIVVVIAFMIMRSTRFGRAAVLVGANRATAELAGVPIARVTVAVFVIASVAATIAGIFGAAQFEQARMSAFIGLDFDVVAAVLIGGTAIHGGEGSPLRTALGAIFIAMVQNYMLLLGWSFGPRTLVLGALIMLAVVVFHMARQRGGRS
jgi:ribose transport system permease protein